MEIFAAIVFIVLATVIAATVSAILKDGLKHNPPATSHRHWDNLGVPSTGYWDPRV